MAIYLIVPASNIRTIGASQFSKTMDHLEYKSIHQSQDDTNVELTLF